MGTNWTFDDGGRKAAGFKGSTGDCVYRAIAIATGTPYDQVCAMVANAAFYERPGAKRRKGRRSNQKNGVFKATIDRIMRDNFPQWKWTPTMSIGSGCKVHVRADELPKGKIILSLSKHLAAMIDGVVHDTHDPSRGGTRCVYGYWSLA
jgi:hypothetical protein